MAINVYEHPEIEQRAQKLRKAVRKAIQAAGVEADEGLRKIGGLYISVQFGEVGAHPLGGLSGIGGKRVFDGQNKLLVSYTTATEAPYSAEGYKAATLQDNKRRKLDAKTIAEAVLAVYRKRAAIERAERKDDRNRRKADAAAKRLTREYKAPAGTTDEIHVDVRAFERAHHLSGHYYTKTKRQGVECQAYNVAIKGLTEDEAALVLERLPSILKGFGK